MKLRTEKKSAMIFGEGKQDSIFINDFLKEKSFNKQFPEWIFFSDHGSGGSPEDILKLCRRVISGKDYTAVVCLIDLDQLKKNYHKKDLWKRKKLELEQNYGGIFILWQENNAQEETKRELGIKRDMTKRAVNRLSRSQISKLINKGRCMRIANYFKCL